MFSAQDSWDNGSDSCNLIAYSLLFNYITAREKKFSRRFKPLCKSSPEGKVEERKKDKKKQEKTKGGGLIEMGMQSK